MALVLPKNQAMSFLCWFFFMLHLWKYIKKVWGHKKGILIDSNIEMYFSISHSYCFNQTYSIKIHGSLFKMNLNESQRKYWKILLPEVKLVWLQGKDFQIEKNFLSRCSGLCKKKIFSRFVFMDHCCFTYFTEVLKMELLFWTCNKFKRICANCRGGYRYINFNTFSIEIQFTNCELIQKTMLRKILGMKFSLICEHDLLHKLEFLKEF